MDNPLGNGFGSFSQLSIYAKYPHNIMLESLYEMGLIGGLAMFVFLLIALRVLFNLLYAGWKYGDRFLQVIGLLLGYIIVVAMKSGDLTSIGRLVFLTILFSGIKYRRNRARQRWSASILP